jgi:hypothetical protein
LHTIRKYIDILNEDQIGLREGEYIPLPPRVLRIAGAPLDFYQILKMLANPNLSHKVTYRPALGRAGVNATDIMMVFYDDISFQEAKDLFDCYGISYIDGTETAQVQKKNFKSKLNPPTDADELYGQREGKPRI